jgi:hypothetical protein
MVVVELCPSAVVSKINVPTSIASISRPGFGLLIGKRDRAGENATILKKPLHRSPRISPW